MKSFLRDILSHVTRPQVVVLACCTLILSFSLLIFGPSPATEPLTSTPVLLTPHVAGKQHRRGRPDCAQKPCMALTFDDGPSEKTTPAVLDVLAKHNVKATFFVVGSKIDGRQAILRRAFRDGNEIGSHGWSHTDLTKLSPGQIEAEIAATQTAVAKADIPLPVLLRPPYGAVNDTVLDHADMTIVRWNIDPDDWAQKDSAKVVENTIAAAKPGGIILLHDTKEVTPAALDQIIAALSAQYQFVTVSQLLQVSRGAQGQYFAH